MISQGCLERNYHVFHQVRCSSIEGIAVLFVDYRIVFYTDEYMAIMLNLFDVKSQITMIKVS